MDGGLRPTKRQYGIQGLLMLLTVLALLLAHFSQGREIGRLEHRLDEVEGVLKAAEGLPALIADYGPQHSDVVVRQKRIAEFRKRRSVGSGGEAVVGE